MIADNERPDDAVATQEAPAAVADEGSNEAAPRGRENSNSKRNALTHGLTAKSEFPVDLAAQIARLTVELAAQYRPTSDYERRLIHRMARAGAQYDMCGDLKVINLQRMMNRTVDFWDSDRKAYIYSTLGPKLSRDSMRVAFALGRTKQGTDWMLHNWEGLLDVVRVNGRWNEAQRRLAFDLLGVRRELRDGHSKLPPDASAVALEALALAQIATLRTTRDKFLVPLDESERRMVAAGMPGEEDPETRRLRRYEASARLDYYRALGELLESRETGTEAADSSATTTKRKTDPAPTPRPVTSKAGLNFLVKNSLGAGVPYPRLTPDPEEPAAAPTPAPAAAAAVEPHSTARPAAAPPPPAVASRDSSRPEPGPSKRRDDERRQRRAREKQARKAARRQRRK